MTLKLTSEKLAVMSNKKMEEQANINLPIVSIRGVVGYSRCGAVRASAPPGGLQHAQRTVVNYDSKNKDGAEFSEGLSSISS